MPRSKKREGLVVKATNTTLSRIIVIHEFYYVFLSVSDLSQYVSTWPSKITARLSREIRVCYVGRMSLAYFQEKKIDGLVVQLNEDTVQVACWLLDQ